MNGETATGRPHARSLAQRNGRDRAAGMKGRAVSMTGAAVQARGLSPRQRQAAEMYAQGETQTAIAQELEVVRRTVYAWIQRPEFMAEVARIIEVNRGALRRRLVREADHAVDALAETVRATPSGPPSHAERTAAALGILRAVGVGERAGAGPDGGAQVQVLVVTSEQVAQVRAQLRGERLEAEGA